MTVQEIKNRFGIVGHSPLLHASIETARQVAPTDISVLITGESGTGKEVFPQIIHHLSSRKHGQYIAVNCGAIPEGTIDSELFGHEKGSFTGAHEARKGYFEVVNGGTIFLDEVADLPLGTQVRLLRVLETGEFIKVGSSKVQKTNVRVVAATNVNIGEYIDKGKFREDLYYRLCTVPIHIPPLRKRKEDIELLYRKFATDFAEKYKMPPIQLMPDALQILVNAPWPGNVRQLKNVIEQISILEQNKEINGVVLHKYLPADGSNLPAVVQGGRQSGNDYTERDLLYKVLFDMKKDLNDLKRVVANIIQNGSSDALNPGAEIAPTLENMYEENRSIEAGTGPISYSPAVIAPYTPQQPIEVQESISLQDQEKQLIIKVLEKYRGKRKPAAKELGISERTLYRKIKEYNID
ncbi:MAG TPA: sigma-54 dependent transcriptional regulator [Bacteroidia bacterium]|nr:sigma-54 dependent transcriptional regulator [Bacteroidia bacterium]HNT80464.1 sigma-54 dependent transcriptional regulator [Bacteroidia bacterium]